jgi:hypothetical protein
MNVMSVLLFGNKNAEWSVECYKLEIMLSIFLVFAGGF